MEEIKSSDFSDVFVSYRRKDVEFTKQLVEALQAAGKDCWIDWEDIPPGSVGFSDDIKRGLEGADAFIAILTPDYLESPYCVDLELKYAVQLKKKLIPVVLKKFDGYDIPADISHINWIYFTPHAGHENTFEESIPKVLQALDTDLEHVRTHKRLLLRALEWEANERKTAYLMRGNALAEAESWLAAAADRVPPPTELHGHYILESRKAATAQQRQLLALAGVAVVVMAILSIFAVWQWREAERNKDIAEANEQLALRNAEESRSLALAANAQLNLNNDDYELAMALALEGSEITDPPQDTVLVLDEAAHLPGTRYVLEGHTAAVNAVAISPDDSFALSASDDNSVRLWNIATGEQVAVLEGHESAVTSVVYSSDGEQAFSCDTTGNIIVWNIADAAEATRMASSQGACNDLLAMPDGDSVLAAYNDGALILWDTASGDILRENNDHTKPVGALALSPDGTLYASAENDAPNDNPVQIIVWNVESGEEVARLDMNGNVTDIDFSNDGADLFVSQDTSGGGIIRRINIESGEVVQSLIGHVSRSETVRVFEQGALAITGSADKTAILWQLNSNSELQPVWQYIGHGSAVYDVAATSDGRRLVTASADNTLRVWDTQNSAVTATGFGHADYVENTIFNGDASVAYSIGAENTIFAWDTVTGDPIPFDMEIEISDMYGLAFNAATNTLLISNSATTAQVVLIDAASGEVIHDLPDIHSGWVRSVAMTSDGQIGVSVGTNDNTVAFYNLSDGTLINQIPLDGRPASIAFNHTGDIVAIGTLRSNRVHLLNVSTQEEIRSWDVAAGVWGMAFSSDDTQIAVALGNGQIALYDTASGELIRSLVGHSSGVNDVAFLGGEQWLVSVSDDSTVRVWNTNDGTQVRRITLFSPIYGLDVSVDGQSAIVAMDDGTVQFLTTPPYTVDALIEWVNNNRYLKPFTCDEQRVYHLDATDDSCS